MWALSSHFVRDSLHHLVVHAVRWKNASTAKYFDISRQYRTSKRAGGIAHLIQHCHRDGCLMDIETNILFTIHEGALFCGSMMLALITYSKGAPFYNALPTATSDGSSLVALTARYGNPLQS